MNNTINRFIRLPEVMHMTGLKRATIYKHIKENKFPRQCKAGERAAVWLEADIQQWIAQRIGGAK